MQTVTLSHVVPERTKAGVTDLNIELERQKLDQTDVRERLKDVQLLRNATEVSYVACEH